MNHNVHLGFAVVIVPVPCYAMLYKNTENSSVGLLSISEKVLMLRTSCSKDMEANQKQEEIQRVQTQIPMEEESINELQNQIKAIKDQMGTIADK